MISQVTFRRQILRVVVLTLSLAYLVAGAGWLPAQDQVSSPNQPVQSPGISQPSTHATREAAGEAAGEDKHGEDKQDEDKTSRFKLSPSVTFVAKKLGISTERASLLSFLFNFLLIAGVIGWAARKYLPGTLSARTAAIQRAMQEAQKSSEEARRKLAEIESRLMKLDVEIGMMRDSAEKEAAAEEARIQAATQEDLRKMVDAAHQEIDASAKAARRALTSYAADLAVRLAREQIHVDTSTDLTLVKNFAGLLGASSSDVGKPGRDRH